MIGFDLLRPELIVLTALAPLVLVLGAFAATRRRRELAVWLDPRQWSRALPGFSLNRTRARTAMAALALLLLAFAALGPVRGYTTRPVATRGLDLVVCIDTSRSMLAQDLRPSRLERAKREVRGLLERLKGDRVALIAFSGDSREVAPLTRDRAALSDLLSFVTPDDNQVGGTNLAAAIERALAMFDGRTGAHEAIVLLTDGEDLEGQGAALAEEAARRKIRVYVVGIGTEAGGKIPVVGAGGRAEFLRDPEGTEVVTRLEGETLERLASTTGGAYLSAEASPTPLEDLYRSRVTRLEGREIESGERRIPHDRFQWALVLALLLMLAESALRERRRAPRPGARSRAAAAALLLVLPGNETFSYATTLAKAIDAHRSNAPEKARLALEALRKDADALELTENERARLEYAAGVIYAARTTSAEALDEAASADLELARTGFRSARALAGPGELRLDATYDLGVLTLWDGERARSRIPELGGTPVAAAPAAQPGAPDTATSAADPLQEAREAYRAARAWFLERLRAESRDADTRANLELVQRRLRELERIEEQRKQQEQEQQQKNDQQDQDQKQEQQGENQEQQPSEGGEQSQDKEGEGQPPEGQQEPQDESGKSESQPPAGGEDQPQPEPQPGEEQEQPAAQEPAPQEQPGEAGEEAGQEQPAGEAGETAERVLTREEVMRLLDKLAELEERGQALEAALRAARRVPVKKDW